jgi:TPR repeat protein
LYSSLQYFYSELVEKDIKKGRHYLEHAAIGGYARARDFLGIFALNKANAAEAVKHWTFAAAGGKLYSLERLKGLAVLGLAAQDDYSKAKAAYDEYLVEVTSDKRDEAAAVAYENKYLD